MTAHVLFVDDEEPNLVVFEAICGDEFPLLLASSAKQAFEMMQNNDVAVILADQRMPEETGVELLERVQQTFPDTIRLLITAYSDLQAAEAAINRGQVRRYLRKPWEPESLKAELRDAYDLYMLNHKIQALESRLNETERTYSAGVIAQGVADEIRNPIGWIDNSVNSAEQSMKTASSVLAKQPADVTRARGLLSQGETTLSDAHAGILRVKELLHSLSHPVGQETPEQVDLAEVIRLAIRLAERSGLRRKALIEVSAGVAPKVQSIKVRLVQVLLNLLANAVQSVSNRISGQGVVRVSTAKIGKNAVIDVSDNGPPLTQDELVTVFTPFGDLGRASGARLGLAISKQIATDAGGTLTAESIPDKGNRFRLSLPLE